MLFLKLDSSFHFFIPQIIFFFCVHASKPKLDTPKAPMKSMKVPTKSPSKALVKIQVTPPPPPELVVEVAALVIEEAPSDTPEKQSPRLMIQGVLG